MKNISKFLAKMSSYSLVLLLYFTPLVCGDGSETCEDGESCEGGER